MRWSLFHQSNIYRTNTRQVSIRSLRHSKAETVGSLDKWSPRIDRQPAQANCTQYCIWTRSNCSIWRTAVTKMENKKEERDRWLAFSARSVGVGPTHVVFSVRGERSLLFVCTCSAFKIECSILYSFAFLRIFAVTLGTRLTAAIQLSHHHRHRPQCNCSRCSFYLSRSHFIMPASESSKRIYVPCLRCAMPSRFTMIRWQKLKRKK